MTEKYLSTREVSEAYGIPEGSLRFYRHLNDGSGPPSFRMGKKRVVYRRSEVERWVAEQEQAEQVRRSGVA